MRGFKVIYKALSVQIESENSIMYYMFLGTVFKRMRHNMRG